MTLILKTKTSISVQGCW